MNCFKHELSWLIKLLCRCGGLVNILTYQGTCSELPIGGHLRTDAVFPVKEGAEVYVNCVDGYTLASGDRMITCVQDAHYISPKQLPTCIIGNENISIKHITDVFCKSMALCVALGQVNKLSITHPRSNSAPVASVIARSRRTMTLMIRRLWD